MEAPEKIEIIGEFLPYGGEMEKNYLLIPLPCGQILPVQNRRVNLIFLVRYQGDPSLKNFAG